MMAQIQIQQAQETGISIDRIKWLLPKALIAATAAFYVLVLLLASQG